MLYIKIGEEKYPAKTNVFKTQFGNEAIRVISDEAPVAQDGFLIVNDKDEIISNRSDYIYLLREEGNCKEYTKVEETIIPIECSKTDVPHYSNNGIYKSLAAISQRVNDITPFTESKTAYIDDTELFFDIGKEGNISVFMVDSEGQDVPFTFEKINGQIKVSFDKRDSLATVTISIQ